MLLNTEDEVVKPPSIAGLTVKAILGNTTKTLQTSFKVTYRELRRKLQQLHGAEKLKLKYKDSDGDLVTLRRQQDLADWMKGT
jgi:hypothetical protein